MKSMIKKATAISLSMAMILGGGSTVMAESYQEAEKAGLARFIEGFSSYWDLVFSQYDKAMAGSKALMTLTLEDGGKSLLSAMTGGMDFSWLNNLSMDMTATIQEGKEIANADILLNDSPLCTYNIYMDMADMMQYQQIPEMTESWLKIPMMEAMETATEEMDEESAAEYQDYMEEYQAQMQLYTQIMNNLLTVLPDTETLSTLLDRYGNLFIDNTAEGTSMEEALSVEGISEECTVYESEIHEQELMDISRAILNAANEDEELKGLLESWDEVGGTDLYSQFKEAVEGAVADMEGVEATEENPSIINSKIWTNADGKIKGREISVFDGSTMQPVFTWKSPSADGTSALLIEFGDPQNPITFTGSGQTAGDVLSGEYALALGGVKAAVVSAENVTADVSQLWSGKFDGTYTIAFPGDPSLEEQNPLGALGLVCTVSSDMDAAAVSQIGLTLTSSGTPLLTLTVEGGYADSGAEAPGQEELDAAIDMADEAEAAAYNQSLDFTAILDNAVAAGVPQELLEVLFMPADGSAAADPAAEMPAEPAA